MPKPLSKDLRERMVAAVQAGGSLRAVAKRFGVAPSSVSKIHRRWRESGSVAPKPMGGDRRSHVIESHHERILELIRSRPDLTLAEVRAALQAQDLRFAHGTLWRFFARHGISFKKNRARRRARQAGCAQGPQALAQAPGAARSGPAGVP